MQETILYQDNLVEITNDSIFLKKYYFPSMKPKEILFTDIKSITVLSPTVTNGKWRLHGTGNIRTWFPMDMERPKRDKIFLLSYKNTWFQSGFTVEDSDAVQKIFESKGLLFNK